MEEQNTNSTRSKVIIALLLLALIAMFIWVFLQRTSLNKLVAEKEQEKTALKKELDSVVVEHNKIKSAYGTLSNTLKSKDSLIQANATEIKKLLDTQWEYNKVRKKLELLQKVAQIG